MDVGVGILGGGTVGGALAHRLLTERETIATKAGISLDLRYLVVRELDKPRPYAFPSGVLTDQAQEVVDDPAELDRGSERKHFSRYPVLFGP